MDKNFLLTFSCADRYGIGVRDYYWYETAEEMIKDIESRKQWMEDFKVIEAIEVIVSRSVIL